MILDCRFTLKPYFGSIIQRSTATMMDLFIRSDTTCSKQRR